MFNRVFVTADESRFMGANRRATTTTTTVLPTAPGRIPTNVHSSNAFTCGRVCSVVDGDERWFGVLLEYT